MFKEDEQILKTTVTTRTMVLTPRLSSSHNTVHQDTGTEVSGKEERERSKVPFQTPKSALRMELDQNWWALYQKRTN